MMNKSDDDDDDDELRERVISRNWTQYARGVAFS